MIQEHPHEKSVPPEAPFLLRAFRKIAADTACRLYLVLGIALSLPSAQGAPAPVPGYPHLNSTNPTFYDFQLEASTSPEIIADANYFTDRVIRYNKWISRAEKIRDSGGSVYCAGNLSLALDQVGEAYKASSNGSSALLTLLPTAGALIGAPAKELWVLYKLVPLAGFFASVLSLGGSIIPEQVSAYANLEDFSYSGMTKTGSTHSTDGFLQRRPSSKTWNKESETDLGQISTHFADQVYVRAMDARGPSKAWKVSLGIAGLMACTLLICGACYMLSSGSIVVWWCTADNWAFAWYAITIVASVLDSYANTPFAKDWVVRISRAPQLQVSADAPWVIPPQQPVSGTLADESAVDYFSDQPLRQQGKKVEDRTVVQELHFGDAPSPSIIDTLQKGFNTQGHVIMDRNTPWEASKDPFYVIISRDGVRKGFTLLRLVSKLVSVTAFIISTSLFASSTLLQIQPATIVMTLVLCAGIFGRVTAMWISAIIMRDRPVLHRIVKSKREADVFLEAIIRKDGLVCEVLGHIIVNGRCIKRRGWFTLSTGTVLGVLAPPFNIAKFALPSSV